MTLRSPVFLLLIPLLLLLFLYKRRKGRKGALGYSSINRLKLTPISWKVRLVSILRWVKAIALVLIIIAMARPVSQLGRTKVTGEGLDIVLAIDVSTSMLAEDFAVGGKRQNRLYVVKEVIEDFIKKRPSDRIGIVVFAGSPYTLSPLTWDHSWLLTQLKDVECGMVEDGTAIGSALTTSLNRLRDSDAKSKIIILLTDGQNNAGSVLPQTAAEASKSLGIKVYTIGAGSMGPVPYPMRDVFGNIVYRQVQIDLDEELLQEIANITGGMYFRATDSNSLRRIYEEIDKMEKTEIEMEYYFEYKELYLYFLLPAMAMLFLEIILKNTIVRSYP